MNGKRAARWRAAVVADRERARAEQRRGNVQRGPVVNLVLDHFVLLFLGSVLLGVICTGVGLLRAHARGGVLETRRALLGLALTAWGAAVFSPYLVGLLSGGVGSVFEVL